MSGFRRAAGRRQFRVTREDGFTLVELLVVILILGILAATAIPAFFTQADKAKNAGAQQVASAARKAVLTRQRVHQAAVRPAPGDLAFVGLSPS